MIEKIENKSEFNSWDNFDIFTVRILSLLNSYGVKYPFATYYKQVIDGKICAIISKLDNDFTVSLKDGADFEELTHFFCVSGYSSILSSADFIFGARYDEGEIMFCDRKKEYDLGIATLDEYPKLMDLFNFVDYAEQDFKSWYVDISHRVRHKSGKAYTLNIDGAIISSGILSSITEHGSILTAVRTEDEFRGMGYGSALVSAICSDVKGRVYIMREKGLNERFYTRLGFENCGKWRLYK